MGVTAAVLTERAKNIGLPIAENEFEGSLENPVPHLPYLVYQIPYVESRGADNVNNLVAEDWNLELYARAIDGETVKIVKQIEKQVLCDVDYEKFEAYIPDEDCYQIAFEIKGLLRKVKGAKKA